MNIVIVFYVLYFTIVYSLRSLVHFSYYDCIMAMVSNHGIGTIPKFYVTPIHCSVPISCVLTKCQVYMILS